MHKYYNFSRIYEAEQTGEPLKPEEMGLPENGTIEAKPNDFDAIKNSGYQIEIMLTQADLDKLIKDGEYSTTEAKWKKADNKTDIKDIASLTINIGEHQISQSADSIIFKIDKEMAEEVSNSLQGGGQVTKVIAGTTVNFIKSNDIQVNTTTPTEHSQVEESPAESATEPTASSNESSQPKRIMSFNQFVNEGKSNKSDNLLTDVLDTIDKGANKAKVGKVKSTKKDKLSKVKPLVEQNEGGHGESSRAGDEKVGTGYFRDNLTRDISKPYHFGKDKMKTGSDEVDTNTLEYTNLINKLKNSLTDPSISSGTPLTVIGGASSVGSSSGYDNKALAQRRADKLVAKIKADVPGIEKKYKITTLANVGGATELNSAKALAQQYVDVSFTEPSTALQRVSYEVDNAIGYNANIVPSAKKGEEDRSGSVKTKRICVQIPETYLNQYLEVINKFKKDNPSAGLKYGVYDIKK